MLLNWLKISKSAKPYSQLAYIYDYVMRFVNYQSWASYLAKLFLKAEIPVEQVLDISCGTGNLIFKLFDLNFKVAGFDRSVNMVQVTNTKARKLGLQIPIWQSSMLNFAVKHPFHAVVCTYDSINYCLDLDACLSVFLHVSNALYPGGVFIFDICTEKNSKVNFHQYYATEQTDNFQYIRQSHYDRKKKLQINDFHIMLHSNSSATYYKERHLQRIYKIEEITSIIPRNRFQIVGIYDGFSMRSGTEKSDRVQVLLKRI